MRSPSSSTINIVFQNLCCSLVRALYASFFCPNKENPPETGTAIICSSACLTGIDYFIAHNNCKDTIVTLNTSNDHGKYVRYYLQQLGKNTQQTKHILVVDDKYDINLMLEYILNQSGFRVYSFTNPLITLEGVKPGLFDLDVKYIMKCRQQK